MEDNYYKTKESVKEYIEMAKDVNSQKLIEQLKNYLPENSNLLELGSGPGADWRILNDYYKVTGSDNSPQFLDHLKNKNPEGNFLNLNAQQIETTEIFSGIYSNKVLIHLSNEEIKQSVKRQHEVLNENGIICHSFWKGTGDEIFKGLFVNYHNKESLEQLFKGKFELLLIKDYMEFEPNDSICLIARKK